MTMACSEFLPQTTAVYTRQGSPSVYRPPGWRGDWPGRNSQGPEGGGRVRNVAIAVTDMLSSVGSEKYDYVFLSVA